MLNQNEIKALEKFIQEVYTEGDFEGCYYHNIDGKYYLVFALMPADYCGEEGDDYYLCGKIAFNCDDLQCDYDVDWYMPSNVDDDIIDTEITMCNTYYTPEELAKDFAKLYEEVEANEEELVKAACHYEVWAIGYNGDNTANDCDEQLGDEFKTKEEAIERADACTDMLSIFTRDEIERYCEPDEYMEVRVEMVNDEGENIETIYSFNIDIPEDLRKEMAANI